jgi:hypothetical protein
VGELIALAKIAFSQVPAAAWEDRSLFARHDYFLTVWHPARLVAIPKLVLDSAVRIVLLDKRGERWRELVPPFPVTFVGDRIALLTVE